MIGRCVCSAQAMHTRTSHTTIAHKHTADRSARPKRKLRRTLIHLRWAYGKHMLNIHLEDIMRFHAFTIRKDLCMQCACSQAILGLSRLGSNYNDTSNSVCSASLFPSRTFDSSIQKLNELKNETKRVWIALATIGRTLEAHSVKYALLHSLVSEGAFNKMQRVCEHTLHSMCTQNPKPNRIHDRFVWSMQIAWMQLFNVYVHTTNLLFPFSLLLPPSSLSLLLCRCRCECSWKYTIKCFRTHFRSDVTMQFLYECLKKCHFPTGERKKEIKWKRSESNKATTMTKTATATVVCCNKMSMTCVLFSVFMSFGFGL